MKDIRKDVFHIETCERRCRNRWLCEIYKILNDNQSTKLLNISSCDGFVEYKENE